MDLHGLAIGPIQPIGLCWCGSVGIGKTRTEERQEGLFKAELLLIYSFLPHPPHPPHPKINARCCQNSDKIMHLILKDFFFLERKSNVRKYEKVRSQNF